jgi:hypothetical protein
MSTLTPCHRITHEVYFNVLDFLPMILCLAVFNFVHPGFVLSARRARRA